MTQLDLWLDNLNGARFDKLFRQNHVALRQIGNLTPHWHVEAILVALNSVSI